MDQIHKTIQDYKSRPKSVSSTDKSIKQIARRISIHDEEEKDELIESYLREVKKNLLKNLSEFDKSDTSMKSGTSNDIAEAQSEERDFVMSTAQLDRIQEFLDSTKTDEVARKAKGKEKL